MTTTNDGSVPVAREKDSPVTAQCPKCESIMIRRAGSSLECVPCEVHMNNEEVANMLREQNRKEREAVVIARLPTSLTPHLIS